MPVRALWAARGGDGGLYDVGRPRSGEERRLTGRGNGLILCALFHPLLVASVPTTQYRLDVGVKAAHIEDPDAPL